MVTVRWALSDGPHGPHHHMSPITCPYQTALSAGPIKWPLSHEPYPIALIRWPLSGGAYQLADPMPFDTPPPVPLLRKGPRTYAHMMVYVVHLYDRQLSAFRA